MSSSSDITKLLRFIDEASAKFSGKLPAIERRMLEEVLLLARRLEVKNGKIASSMANLKLINGMRGKLEKLTLSREYIKDVAELARSCSAIAAAQQAYFKGTFGEFKPKPYYDALRDAAIASTVEGLTESGIRANVLKPINDLLRTGVTSGMSYAQMEQSLRTVLTETDGGSGALSRYAKTYAVDSVSQLAGEYMAAVTADLKTDWFVYRGSNIETTREFCKHLTKKEYVHKSEIPEILTGHIDGHKCKIYDRTGLPYGMKEGTTPENFMANRGGWNCQHQLMPVREDQVPMELRKRFEKQQRYTPEELKRIKKTEKSTIDYGRENIIGKVEFKHEAFGGKAAIFNRNSFTENLRYGSAFELKADILRNIDAALKDVSYNRFDKNIKLQEKPTVDGYFVFVGTYKDRKVEYLFEKRKEGIVFHFIKLV